MNHVLAHLDPLDRIGRVVIVQASGDMTDSEDVSSFLARSKDALADSRHDSVLLDLREAEPVDTKLIAAMVIICRYAASAPDGLYLLPSHTLRKWIHICRLEALFESLTIRATHRHVRRHIHASSSSGPCIWHWQGAPRCDQPQVAQPLRAVA